MLLNNNMYISYISFSKLNHVKHISQSNHTYVITTLCYNTEPELFCENNSFSPHTITSHQRFYLDKEVALTLVKILVSQKLFFRNLHKTCSRSQRQSLISKN